MKFSDLIFDDTDWTLEEHQPAEPDVGIHSAYDVIHNEGEVTIKNKKEFIEYTIAEVYELLRNYLIDEECNLHDSPEIEIDKILFDSQGITLEFSIVATREPEDEND